MKPGERESISSGKIFYIRGRIKSIMPSVKYFLILNAGIEKFMECLRQQDCDGLMVPDLPVEEAGEFMKCAHKYNARMIFFISPLTSPERMKMIEQVSDDFVYCVSVPGVTGIRKNLYREVEPYLRLVRLTIAKPFVVGFGVSNADDAGSIAKLCNGIVIGSALIDLIKRNSDNGNLIEIIRNFSSGIKNSIKPEK